MWLVRYTRAHDAIATITLDERADPELWQQRDDPTGALYAHRMVVMRAEAGKGLGSSMLDWASRRAAMVGKKWLRLDVWATNSKLQDYYVNEGFENVRTLRFAHRGSGALFQRPAGVELGRGPRLLPETGTRDAT